MSDSLTFVKDQISESSSVIQKMVESCSEQIVQVSEMIIQTIENGGKVLWCGNGGSAAQAQHLSTELMGGLRNHHRNAVASVSLTTDSSFLTAWSNDVEFEFVFAKQVEGLGKEGDILIAISTSGNSANIIKAMETAKQMGLKTVALTGEDGGKLRGIADVEIKIPTTDTQRIQEGHILSGHLFCELVEKHVVNRTG
tara:strand:- start:7713 stop:8303 length:591 start_codon:yes stop_codon:yes gene_type:complete